MKSQQPIASDGEHRVLEFRPRPRPQAQRIELGKQPPLDASLHLAKDLSRYERDRSEPDDFRQRMLANLAAVAFTVALMAVGIWLTVNIAGLRKTQDCVLMGRRDCAHISAP